MITRKQEIKANILEPLFLIKSLHSREFLCCTSILTYHISSFGCEFLKKDAKLFEFSVSFATHLKGDVKESLCWIFECRLGALIEIYLDCRL